MSPDDFRRLVAAGLSTEQVAVVMEMMERDRKAFADAEEARKSKGRDRMAKWRLERHRNVTVTQPNVTEQLVRGDAHVEDKTLTSENTQKEESKKETRASALSSEFDTFWAEFPNKTGKPKARSSFVAARRKADMPTIMAGLARYVAARPPDRPWLNPTTFLNQERWDDQPATVVPFARGSPPANASPFDHFRNYAGEINGQDRDDRSSGGLGNDASGIPIRAIEHHG